MKNNDQKITLLNTVIASDRDLNKVNIKTTDINILLNRVRLDRERIFKKRFIYSFFLVAILSSMTVYFII